MRPCFTERQGFAENQMNDWEREREMVRKSRLRHIRSQIDKYTQMAIQRECE